MLQQLLLGMLLDDGGVGIARSMAAAVSLVVLALFVAVLIPLVVIAAPRNAPANGETRQTTVHRPSAAGAIDQRLPPSFSQPVEVARRYLGVHYLFGGTDPASGLDCSGLVQLVFRQLGVALPRTAQLQYQATARVGQGELQPGDLVFFARTYADPYDWITHVGIYIGDGQQINAPTEGQVVSIQPVFSGFWGAHFAGAGRVPHP